SAFSYSCSLWRLHTRWPLPFTKYRSVFSTLPGHQGGLSI
ncbi:transketolase, pyrimidine binding domain protein, partial [Chlamydia psittaci 08-2626_L3]